MGGDDAEDPGQESPMEELGSVGDWRLPGWVHRIPGLAWLFVGLALADVVVELAIRLGLLPAPGDCDPAHLVGGVAFALPILIPAAIIVRARERRPTVRDPLLGGSIAIAVSSVLGTVGLVVRDGFTPWRSETPRTWFE